MSKVVVMIEDDDGRRDWWEIFDVEDVGWNLLAPGAQGARARMWVQGSFYRKATDVRSREIASQMRAALDRDRRDELGGWHGSEEDR